MDNHTETIVYAIRHGETEWNIEGKQQGHLDSPLTENGIKQAHAIADALARFGIAQIYSSDLGRAVQTAEIISSKLNIAASFDQRLRERNLGSLQGMTKNEYQNKFPKDFSAFLTEDPDYVIPGGESARCQYRRCTDGCTELAMRHPGGKILIVTHGGVLTSLFYYTLGIPLEKPRCFSLFNAAINSFSVINHRWHLNTWGDISHLIAMNVFGCGQQFSDL